MIRQLVPFSALLISAFMMFVAIGLTNVLIPVRTGLEGWSATTLGWIGTAAAAAFTGACYFMPIIIRRVGHIRSFAAFQTVLASTILLNGLLVDPISWIVIRFIGGAAAAGSYMIIESWLNEKASNENRGFLLSVYMVISMIGMLVGQYMLAIADPSTNVLFMAVAILFSGALLPMTLSVIVSPTPPEQVKLDLRALFRNSPAGVVGALTSGILFGTWFYFAPSYGQSVGLSTIGVSTILGAGMLGGTLFQFPIGRLSDKIDRRIVMGGIGFVGLASTVTFAIVQPSDLLLLTTATFLVGATLFPSYALAIAHTNDYTRAEDFVAVSGGLLITYGIGTALGPQIGGRLIEVIGPSGFFITLAMSFGVYGSYSLFRITRRAAVPAEERDDFSVVPVTLYQTPEVYQLDPRTEESRNDNESGDIDYDVEYTEDEEEEATARAG